MTNLKYALIGYGRRGKSHLSVAMALQGTFDIVGVCDADLQSAEEGAAVASTGRSIPVTAYTDLPKMIDQEKPDICDVVVPVDLHHVVSCYLSMRGIHHNVETGLAPTLGLMELMIETARRHSVKLQTSENFPFVPIEQFVCHLIRSGVIGPVHKTYRLFSTTGYHGLAAMSCRMNAIPIAVSSIGHGMPVVPYVDRAKRDFSSERLEFYAVDYDNGGMGIAMVGNKNGCLGRNQLVGFETCGERGTIITNGNQGATGGETVNVCTDEDITKRAGKAQTYAFEREYTEDGQLKRIYVELPNSLGGIMEWVNPYHSLEIKESSISLATILDGISQAIREDGEVLWTGEMGRADQEMVIAAARSVQSDRRPIPIPLAVDLREEDQFDQRFIDRFGAHPREDIEKALAVNFKAR